MKKLIAVTAFSLLALSCSDKLTESKVKSLVNNCLSKKSSDETVDLTAGQLHLLTKDEISTYQKLQSKGLLTIEIKPAEQYSSGYHLITLTDKAKPFVLNSHFRGDANVHTVRLYTKKVDKIGSIQEMPAMNIASVKITYKKDDKTPFYDELENDKTDFVIKNITLKKTENNGWVYCD